MKTKPITNQITNHPQGDVNAFVVTADSPSAMQKPKNARKLDAKEVTVALGEATGHAHIVRGDFEVYIDEPTGLVSADEAMELAKWFEIGSEGATIHHEKGGVPTGDHGTIDLPPDSLILIPGRQRAYRPEGAIYAGD